MGRHTVAAITILRSVFERLYLVAHAKGYRNLTALGNHELEWVQGTSHIHSLVVHYRA